MNKSSKKLLVLLLIVIIAIMAVTLVACNDLFGKGDGNDNNPERLLIENAGSEVPEDITEDKIGQFITLLYFDKKGNSKFVDQFQFTIVSFNISGNAVDVTVLYNNLTASATFFIRSDINKDYTIVHFEFITDDPSAPPIVDQMVNKGDRIEEPPYTPNRGGGRFLGWFTDEGEKWDFSQPITLSGENHMTLTAKHEKFVTVNFYSDDEIYSTKQVNIFDDDDNVLNPENPINPEDPEKTNYAFDGWYTSKSFQYENKWLPENVFWMGAESETISVYAKYLATFNVVFDTDGGEEIEPLVVKDGEQFSAPKTAIKNGYKFACWSIYDINLRYNGQNVAYLSDRIVMHEYYILTEETEIDGNVYGLEAGATFTVFAEFYNENEPTEGLYYDDYVNNDGVAEPDKCVVGYEYSDDVLVKPISRKAFAVVIPSTHDGRTVVGINGAFSGNSNLIVAVLPDTIEEIQEYAFSNCTNLVNINIPSSVKVIGNFAFSDCNKLDCVLPEGLESIGRYAFRGTAFSGSLPSTLTSIGNYAFGDVADGGTHLTSVVLPEGLLELGEGAFVGCQDLTSVTITSANCYMGVGVFSNCINLTEVTLPQGIESLPNSTFSNCTSLESIVLPSTIKHIGNYAFYKTKLNSITLPGGLLSIGQSAFVSTAITSVTIPNNVTEIEKETFKDCALLEEVTLPQGILKIGDGAFYANLKLSSINMPSSLTSIDNYAFQYCRELTSITFPNSLEDIGQYAFANCRGLTYVNLAHVACVDERAFDNCSALTTVKMSDMIDTIGSYAFKGTQVNFGALTLPSTLILFGREAFSGCTITSISFNSTPELLISAYAFDGILGLQNASLLGNIKSIGAYAFNGCTDLTSVSLTKAISSITQNAFANSSLKTLNFNGDLYDWLKIELKDTVIADNGITVKFNGQELTGSVTVSPKEGEALTISKYALQGLNKLTSITLVNVKSIEEMAFYGCTELTNVTFSSFATDFEGGVNRNAFDGCDKLQYNVYNNGLYLGNATNKFYVFIKPNDTNITQLSFHADTKIIAGNALFNEEYPNLTKINLHEGLQVIGGDAFYGCNLVTEIVVPDSVVYIGKGAFQGFSALERLTVPFVGEKEYSGPGLNVKLNWLFGGVTSNVPSSLGYVEVTGGIIGSYAFDNCSNLKELNAGKATRVLRNALCGCTSLVKLTVPTSITYAESTGNSRHAIGMGGYFSSGSERGTVPASLKEVTITGGGLLDANTFTECHLLDKVTLGLGVTHLPEGAFRFAMISELHYEGTMEQWAQLIEASNANWAQYKYSALTVVHCSDGDIEL